MRKSRKLIAILATLALLATLLVPMATPALAASTYTMSNVATVKAPSTDKVIGTLQVDLPSVSVGGFVYISLPSSPSSPTGFSFKDMAVSIPGTVEGNANGIENVIIEPASGDGRVIKISHTVRSGAAGNPGRFILGSVNPNTGVFEGLKIDIPRGVTGEIKATLTAPSSVIYTGGSVTIAKVGPLAVSAAVESVPSIGSAGGPVGAIKILEYNFGALVKSDNSLKLTLPSGFTWKSAKVDTVYWGDMSTVHFKYGSDYNNGRDLILDVDAESARYFTIAAEVNVDESVAKIGDISVTLGGDSSVTRGSLTIAKYGDYGVKVSAVGTENVMAGKADQKLGKFAIEELLAGSLIPKRTITLTLPSGVKWTQKPSKDTDSSYFSENVPLTDWTDVGNDGRTIKCTVSDNLGTTEGSTEAAKLVFKDAKVAISPDFPAGDLTVTVGGSAGATGDVVIGKVVGSVTASVASTPDVKIGLPDQNVGDLSITESTAGVIASTVTWCEQDAYGKVTSHSTSNQARLVIKAPAGVTFSSTPTVSVTEGDLLLDNSGIKTDTTPSNEGLLYIPIRGTSTKASTIKITNIKVTVDRTVPEGPLTLSVKGTAVNDTLDQDGNAEIFTATTVASANVAKVVTRAPVEQKGKVVFKINDTTYTVNGVEQTMDVAPYIKDGRTFVPVRYAAQAVGVAPENIMYADGKVTLIKGDNKVVQLTIGSNVMVINGISIAMDVAAELKDGRTMLPFRWVAQALGAKVNWDEATQTVTMEL